ncbi:transcriptional regulator, LuxR family [Kribbella flavida DSM 17836]|uniref:Transcriptional regulator, LuxR family n=1 Tax=Kribbella flavida (strain DSM 17836 / JCM 10339 / NBRC 14399) TaxID=479435 RepID=D2PPD2_KRIFD|nr:SigE family RNA polymerase sigma factor [Kribbella flavida]ADB34728.1 transcriptional regulator, LuxR family [Kribbella flavida DSM 17836]
MGAVSRDEDFSAFVQASSGRLLRYARLLCGDAAQAEDLVQAALEKAYPRWDRIRDGEPYAYVRQVVVNHHLSWLRRRPWRERSAGDAADLDHSSPARFADPIDGLVTGMVISTALDVLTRRERSVIVLRYLEDLTEKQTAEELGLAVGTVKSVTFRALRKLRVSAPLGESYVGEST